ncbi:MAG TPA: PIN domain-containing protein [Candidatus Saccharimonadia bacterium]
MTDTMVFSLTVVSVLIILLAVLRLRHVSLQGLVLGIIGAIVGLLLGALASVPLSKLPDPFGGIMPVVVSVAFTLIVMVAVLSRRRSMLKLMPFLKLEDDTKIETTEPAAPAPDQTDEPKLPRILVDTSVIIDGRIADIARAGFVPGRLVVPRFVLAELQNIADSDDAMRRGRGRRGLDVLNQLREMRDVEVDIITDDVQGIREVDAKLVVLAQRFSCNVLTTDYNLNRVAQIQGVRVLNVNELSNAIRPVVLPGEELIVRVVQPGKERNQGVGYLADGTMIVVENGDKLIGQEVATEVTRVFQTVAGKMIFAVPKGKPGAPTQHHPVAQTQADPAPIKDAEPTDKADKDQRKGRFARSNRKPHGTGGAAQTEQQPGRRAGTGIEERIIAATNNNKPRQHPAE